MRDMQIAGAVQQQIKDFLLLIQATREQQEELTKFYTMISPSLKERVAVQIFTSIIKLNHRFKAVIRQRFEELQSHSLVLKKKIS